MLVTPASPGRAAPPGPIPIGEVFAAQWRSGALFKTVTLPPLRIEPAFREALESLLAEGESLEGWIEAALRRELRRQFRRQSHRRRPAAGPGLTCAACGSTDPADRAAPGAG